MNRISEKFSEAKKIKKIAFMPFFVAGDPDFKTSVEIGKLFASLAEILEIGFPYSDPLADGPTIQAADNRALKKGINTDKVFKLASEIRAHSEIPISILVYANLVYQRGIENFYRDAKKAGVDGILIPDVPVEEASPFIKASESCGIDQIFMVTQTTTPARLKKILSFAKGYIYIVSVLGVTGARSSFSGEVTKLIRKIKAKTSLPLAVGFGISERKHIKELELSGADGAIVGSALVKVIEENIDNKKELLKKLGKFVSKLKE